MTKLLLKLSGKNKFEKGIELELNFDLKNEYIFWQIIGLAAAATTWILILFCGNAGIQLGLN